MAKQCPERVRMTYWLLICVLDDGHKGRHQDYEGGTWKRRD